MAKFCGKCGQPLEDGNLFCSHCGAKIEPEMPKDSIKNMIARTVQSASQNVVALATKKKGLPIVVVLAVVAVVGIAAVFLMNKSSYEQINNEQNGNFLIHHNQAIYYYSRGDLYKGDAEKKEEAFFNGEHIASRVSNHHVVNDRLYITCQGVFHYLDMDSNSNHADEIKVPDGGYNGYYRCDDKYIYFHSKESQHLCRASIDNPSDSIEILSFYANTIIPVDDKLYLTRSDLEYTYKPLDGDKGFWVVNKDGSDLKQLYDAYPMFVLFDGDRIYLCCEDDERKSHLISMKRDGSDVKEIDKNCSYISSVNICNGEIFYTEGDGKTNAFQGQMHKIDKQGNDSVILYEPSLDIEVIDGMLYFYSGGKGNIYRMKPDGTDYTLAYNVN